MEGPPDVVVAAAREGAHSVDRVGFGLAEEDHRHVAVPGAAGLALSEAAAKLGSGEVGEVVAEKSKVRPLLLGQRQRLAARGGLDDREAVLGQMAAQEATCRGLGLGDQEGISHESRR